ncbi:MAG TPA: TonB family protein [Longimicrobium sp.]
MRTLALLSTLALAAPLAAQQQPALPNNGPFTQPPELLNRDEVFQLAQASYPAEMKQAGLGGTPTVRMFVDADGSVKARRLERSSAIPALDSAALKVAEAMRFAPAKDGDRPVPLWVSIPVQFRLQLPTSAETATPPRIRNLYDVQREIGRVLNNRALRHDRYPIVSIYVGADGVPQAFEIGTPSGDHGLDYAALRAAMLSRFDPARDAAGQPVPAWIRIEVHPHR